MKREIFGILPIGLPQERQTELKNVLIDVAEDYEIN
jgi:hypothetical protein